MFTYVTESKKTSAVSIPFEDNDGKQLTRADFVTRAFPSSTPWTSHIYLLLPNQLRDIQDIPNH